MPWAGTAATNSAAVAAMVNTSFFIELPSPRLRREYMEGHVESDTHADLWVRRVAASANRDGLDALHRHNAERLAHPLDQPVHHELVDLVAHSLQREGDGADDRRGAEPDDAC